MNPKDFCPYCPNPDFCDRYGCPNEEEEVEEAYDIEGNDYP